MTFVGAPMVPEKLHLLERDQRNEVKQDETGLGPTEESCGIRAGLIN